MHFRRTLMQAAEKAFSDGEITRRDLFRLRLSTLSERVCSQLEAACAEQAASEGIIPVGSNVGAFDWTTLLSFIKELLPLILQLLSIFSQ